MSEKLHLGCGSVHLVNWTNVDVRYQPGVDRVDNIGILKRYAPNSVTAIYACHCLDHFSRWDYPRVLKRWWELLTPGGLLKLSVIDFEAVVSLYLLDRVPLQELTGCLVAAQDYDSNVRHMHWDWDTLKTDLLATGFGSITRHGPFHEDCSAAQVRGQQISLNVIATK